MEDISDRVYRAAAAFVGDGDYDDELLIHGQVIRSSSRISIGPALQDISGSAENDGLFYAYMLAAAIAGAAIMHAFSRWLHAAFTTKEGQLSKAHQRGSVISAISSKTSTHATSDKQQHTPIPILKTTKSVCVETPIEAPDLVTEDHPVLSTKSSSTTIVTCTARNLTKIPMKQQQQPQKRIALDDAREAVEGVELFTKAMAEKGHSCGMDMALLWVSKQQKTNKIVSFREQQECRGYMWDRTQRDQDRHIGEKRHQETLSARKEDLKWMTKLLAKRDMAFKALVNCFVLCFVGAVAIHVARPVHQALQFWEHASYGDLVCPDNVRFVPILQHDTTSHIFNGIYVNLGGGVACALYSATRAARYIVTFLSLYAGSYALERCLLPESVKRVTIPAFLFFFLHWYQCIPAWQLKRMVFSLTLVAFWAGLCLQYQFKCFQRRFKKIGTPPVTQVNECIEWFDNAASTIQIVPVVGGVFWGLKLMFVGSLATS